MNGRQHDDDRVMWGAFEAAMDPHIIVRPHNDDYQIVHANRAACTLCGSHRDDMVDALLTQAVPDHLRAPLLAACREARVSGRAVSMDDVLTPTRSGDGLSRVDLRVAPAGPTLVLTWRDVTQVSAARRIADEQRRRASRWQLSMDASAIGVAITSTTGVFEYANPALARMLGHTQNELSGTAFQKYTHPDDRQASWAALQHLLDRSVDRVTMRKRYLRRTGEILWIDLAVASVLAEDATVDHFVAQMIDVTAEVEYQHELENTARRFQLLAENASDIVYEIDAAGTIVWISESVQSVLGYEPEELCGSAITPLVFPDDLPVAVERGRRLRDGRGVDSEPIRYLTAAGGVRWMSTRARPQFDSSGLMVSVVVGLRDITSEVAIARALASVEQRLRLAVDATPGGLIITDEAGLLLEVNREFCRLVDRGEDEVIGRPLSEVLAGLEQEHPCPDARHEHHLRGPDREVWLDHAIALMSPEQQLKVHLFFDVTGERRLRERLMDMATHDVLTGVANRRYLEQRLTELHEHPAEAARVGVLICDVDGLKQINDRFGHAVGDRALQAVASRLTGTLRGRDEVVRLGGDEFVVILNDIGSGDDLTHVAQRLCSRVEGTVEDLEPDVRVTASFGAAILAPGEPVQMTLKRADDALYAAKAGGRNQVVVDRR